MKGCRSFTDDEAEKVMEAFSGPYKLRDKAIFALGKYTGERISAILRLQLQDVQDYEYVTYKRSTRKGKTEGRTVKLHPRAKEALISWLESNNRALESKSPIFHGQRSLHKPISRIQYHRILKKACAGLTGKVATHSMRKTFCSKVYENLNHDLIRTKAAMGHKNINSTVSYLSFKMEDIDQAIMGM